MVCSVVYQWRWASSHQGAMRMMVAWFNRYAHVMTTPAHKSVHTNRPSTETPLRYQIRGGSKTREPWPQEVCHHGTLRWHFDASSFPGSKIRVNICYESYLFMVPSLVVKSSLMFLLVPCSVMDLPMGYDSSWIWSWHAHDLLDSWLVHDWLITCSWLTRDLFM